ncbi:hypothetical protein [Dechloromonas hortensis]|uniref:hypothetical protein n=1 Tax=Dechloromonas hortensis TaxID=337779 RepID=UPI001291CFBD|nr:hypothetical protein [Dechloromonas hortensis]
MQQAEDFEFTPPPLYRLVLGEPAFANARTADATLGAVVAMDGRLPDADLVLAAMHRYALLARDPALVDFIASLDEAINS